MAGVDRRSGALRRPAVARAPPAAEVVDRRGWAEGALGTLAFAAEPLERRLAEELTMPGPLGGVARRVVGGGAGIEAGVAVGYAARRVLGQYDVAVFGPARPGRLLFVGDNMESARLELGADRSLFLRWIALHETTHVAPARRRSVARAPPSIAGRRADLRHRRGDRHERRQGVDRPRDPQPARGRRQPAAGRAARHDHQPRAPRAARSAAGGDVRDRGPRRARDGRLRRRPRPRPR